MADHYILDKHHHVIPTDLYTWGKWFANHKNRRVALTEVGDLEVSTVFLGINHRFGNNDRPPLVFETMVFKGGSEYGDYTNRYSSWDDAEAGHKATVRKLEKRKAENARL